MRANSDERTNEVVCVSINQLCDNQITMKLNFPENVRKNDEGTVQSWLFISFLGMAKREMGRLSERASVQCSI